MDVPVMLLLLPPSTTERRPFHRPHELALLRRRHNHLGRKGRRTSGGGVGRCHARGPRFDGLEFLLQLLVLPSQIQHGCPSITYDSHGRCCRARLNSRHFRSQRPWSTDLPLFLGFSCPGCVLLICWSTSVGVAFFLPSPATNTCHKSHLSVREPTLALPVD